MRAAAAHAGKASARWLRAVVVAVALSCLATSAGAASRGQPAAEDQRLEAAIDKWRCPVARYLEDIHRVTQTALHADRPQADRIALVGVPQVNLAPSRQRLVP